jgi:hypothetical protein
LPAFGVKARRHVSGLVDQGEDGAMRLNFIIIGAQKSASTYLQYCLSQHPNIYMHKHEVPIFEDPDFSAFSEYYFDSMFNGRSEERLGIKRPNYMGRPEAPPRICRTVPSAKLIAVLRNPIDRALSAYYYYMAGSYIPLVDPEMGLRDLMAGRYKDNYKRAHEILEFGKYYKYVSMYEHFLNNNRMLLVKQEDLQKKREETLEQTFRFLGVDPSFRPHRLQIRRQPGHYTMLSQRIMRLAGAISFRKDAENTRAFAKDQLALRLIGKSLFGVCRLLSDKVLYKKKPTLSEGLRKSLYEYYEQDIAELEALTGWQLSDWKAC